VSGVWSLVLLIAGVRVPGTWVKVLSVVPIAVVAIFALFDNWIWRLGRVKRLVHRPQLNGTWKGTLVSLREDAQGRETEHNPIPIFVVIYQSYLTLSVCLMSEESKSRSIATVLEKSQPHEYTIYYHYNNLPGLLVRGGSPAHTGGARIEVNGVTPTTLTGEYWTDRRTRGTFIAERVSSSKYGSWTEANESLEGVRG